MRELREIAEDICASKEVIDNPSIMSLREMSSHYSVKNNLDVLLFHTKERARSPHATIGNINVLNDNIKNKVIKEIEKVRNYVKNKKLIIVDRCVGISKKFSLKVKATVSASYPHLSLMFSLNYFQAPEDKDPEIITIDIPEWPKKAIIVDPEENVTFILGTDYYGELKMSALRLAMNYARENLGYLGVHAGSKLYRLNINGELEEKGILVFGLSGTGKSTVIMSNHGLVHPEGIVVRQDDIVILTPDSYAAGTEMNLYPKTDSVNSIPSLRRAVTSKDSILENVAVMEDGSVDFDDVTFCANGRAIAIRELIEGADSKVDVPKVDALFFLMRRVDFPTLGMLTSPEQIVAYFMLGESVRTAAEAGKVGEAVRVPGFDPFIVEPKWKNGKRLYEILIKNPHIKGFVVNTGYVGNKKVTPTVTLSLILKAIKGEIEWKFDEDSGFYVPERVDGIDIRSYDPREVFGSSDYSLKMRRLREERIEYLSTRFPQLSFILDNI